MDHLPTPSIPGAPPLIPAPEGAEPLRKVKHELYARARAALKPRLEAAREAGFTEMTAANAAKLDRKIHIATRIAYLAGNDVEAVRLKRAAVEAELGKVAFANIEDFIVVSKRGWPSLNLNRIQKLGEAERRELMAAVKGISYTEQGPKFEMHPKLDALAQLRKINGLDAPERTEVKTQDVTLERLIGMSYELAQGNVSRET